MRPRRGEVWWGEEPERGRRPYLVSDPQQRDRQAERGPGRRGDPDDPPIPTQVEIDQSDGMREPCAVNLDDLLMMPLGQLTEC